MTKGQYYALLLACFLIATLAFQSVYVDLSVSIKGERVKALIVQVNCWSRNSNLELEHKNANHSILISYTDCVNRKYEIGDTIVVDALPQFKRAQLPGKNQYWGGLFVGLFCSLGFIYALSKKSECLPDASNEKTTTKKDA